MTSYATRMGELIERFKAQSQGPLVLAKESSNLFRDRRLATRRHLDVRQFNHVLAAEPGSVEAEGMVPYDELVAATLPIGAMPAVVPQLKSITLGGALAGVGIESTSFRHGLVHETVLEFDVLTGTGEVLTCTPENEHRRLFYGFPNSYGTLGYALRVKARTLPVRPCVRLEHRRYTDPRTFFSELAAHCRSDADFVDGVVFAADEMVATLARFTDQAPWTSDYSFARIYYRSLRERETDFLSTRDYLWRWDTDWFWCSRNLYAQNPLVRRLYGRSRLNSRTYTKIMRWNSRWGITRILDRIAGRHPESVIQDVDIPVERAAEFLDFLLREIGITPVWICPIGTSAARFDLYPLAPRSLYINFGFWDLVQSRKPQEEGHFNRLVEDMVVSLGGIKSLYSDSYYSPDAFWQIYNRDAYLGLKARYDPQGLFGDLYEKCVLRA